MQVSCIVACLESVVDLLGSHFGLSRLSVKVKSRMQMARSS